MAWSKHISCPTCYVLQFCYLSVLSAFILQEIKFPIEIFLNKCKKNLLETTILLAFIKETLNVLQSFVLEPDKPILLQDNLDQECLA